MQERPNVLALAVLALTVMATAGCATRPTRQQEFVDTFVIHYTEMPDYIETPMTDSVRRPPPEEEKAILAPYRARIDALDAQIVALLGQRFDVVHEVAVLKADREIPPILKDRIEEVVKNARAKAASAGVDPNLVERIYRIIIETACLEEEEYSLNRRIKAQ